MGIRLRLCFEVLGRYGGFEVGSIIVRFVCE